MEKNKTEFIDFILVSRIGKEHEQAIIPLSSDERARCINGHSEDCLFERAMHGLRQTYTLTRKQADRMIQHGDVDYCWKKCGIKDCPAYMANH